VKLKRQAAIFVVFFGVFLYVLNVDAEINNSFYIERSLRDDFLERTFATPNAGSSLFSTTTGNSTTTLLGTSGTKRFAQINNAEEYWTWLSTVFVPEVRTPRPALPAVSAGR
jgi:hypothetical protein